MKLAFSGHLIYDRNEGFRTAKYSFPFNLLEGEYSAQKVMVRLSEESSNTLFETLADWAEILKTTSLGRRLNDNIPPESARSCARKKR